MTDAAGYELAAMRGRLVDAVAALSPPAGARGWRALDAGELLDGYRCAAMHPGDVVEDCLAAIAADCSGAIWAVDADGALAAAERSAARWSTGNARPLEGVPLVVKDLLDTAGLTTTGGSRWLADRVPVADAEVVATARAAGAVVVAKTATYELGCGDERIPFGVVPNPWDTTRISGGSSAGSAVAVATGLAPLALGTDTGGSIRIPAAYCGVTGLKPTLGRLSCAGLLGLAPTLDAPGPMARSAADVSLLFAALTGEAPAGAPPTVHGTRIAVPRRFFCDVLADDVATAFDAALAALADSGAELVEIDVPGAEHGATLSWVITMAEAARTYASAPRDQLSDAFRARLEVGEQIDETEYRAALRARRALVAGVTAALQGCTVAAVPAAVSTAPPFDDVDRPVAGVAATWPDVSARTFALWNVTGLPALALPIGRGDDGLPIGMQLVGLPFADERCIAVGAAFQRITDHHRQRPPLLSSEGRR